MAQKRKTHAEEFKARVAVEAIKGVRTLSELSAAHGVHPTVIAHWMGHRRYFGAGWRARAGARRW
jgi:transposase-like protein